MSKRPPARQQAKEHRSGRIVIDHAALAVDDAEWLESTESLTLWNVTVPDGFLSSLPRLRLLDIRGGSGNDIGAVRGCSDLRALVVNQVRGLHDLSAVLELGAIEFLSLYGLSRVEAPPSLGPLTNLRRLEVGQMRGLSRLGALLDAPHLEELMLIRKVLVTDEDVDAIRSHPTLRAFDWFAEDVPDRQWVPVIEAIGLPKARPMNPEEWLEHRSA